MGDTSKVFSPAVRRPGPAKAGTTSAVLSLIPRSPQNVGSDRMTVAVGFSPRLPATGICGAARRWIDGNRRQVRRRSATKPRFVVHRGLQPAEAHGYPLSSLRDETVKPCHANSEAFLPRGPRGQETSQLAGLEASVTANLWC
jgi:hypothetical protein